MKNFNNVSRRYIKYSSIIHCKIGILFFQINISFYFLKNKQNFNEQDIIISLNGSRYMYINYNKKYTKFN